MTSSVHPKYTTTYPVGNWPAYDRALVQRGEITVWLAPDAIAAWEAVGVGTRGGQRPYSDLAIEPALTLRLIFPRPLRQTEGCLTSLVGTLGLALSAPDHTTRGPSRATWVFPRTTFWKALALPACTCRMASRRTRIRSSRNPSVCRIG